MRIYLEGHSEEYLVHSLALLFLPVSSFRGGEDGKSAESILWKEGGRAFCRTRIEAGGKSAEAVQSVPLIDIKEDDFTALIGRSFYDAGMRLTGMRPPWGTLTGIRPAKRVARMLDAGMSPGEIEESLQREYYTLPGKTRLCESVARHENAALALAGERAVSVYLAIPFCPSRCSYCSFVSASIERNRKLMPQYTDLLIREFRDRVARIRELGLHVATVYIGGGTPTALAPAELAKLLEAVVSELDPAQLLEFSVEAGRPDTVTAEKLRLLKQAGVSRISINPQTLNDRILEEIGRKHTVRQFYDAFALARSEGFDNINADLIAGLPTETEEEFRHSVDGVIALGAENVTVHTLAVKRAARLREEAPHLIEEQSGRIGDMVDYSEQALGQAGYEPYYLYRQKNMLGNFENVGYAKPGYDGLYNLYIMGELHSIFAVGAGATAKFVNPVTGRIERMYNPKYPYEYIERFDQILESGADFAALYEKYPF